jgi:hypothetical protein
MVSINLVWLCGVSLVWIDLIRRNPTDGSTHLKAFGLFVRCSYNTIPVTDSTAVLVARSLSKVNLGENALTVKGVSGAGDGVS